MGAVTFREITAADVPALFDLRPKTRENVMTVEELERLGITPYSVTQSLAGTTKGWLAEDSGQVVGFVMADRATSEFLVIAVLPGHEKRGVGGRLMTLTKDWLAEAGCTRAWLTTGLDTTLRAYGFYRKYGWTDWKIEREMRYMEIDLTETATKVNLRKPVILLPGEGRAYPMGRIRAVFKADEAETQSRYSVSEWFLEPRTQGPGAHSHDEDDLFYVIEGVMSVRVGEEWFDCPKGAFVLVPGGVTHDFEIRGDVRAGVLNFSAPGAFEPAMPEIAEWFRQAPPKDAGP